MPPAVAPPSSFFAPHVSQHTSAHSADLHSVETTPSRAPLPAVRVLIADDNPVVRAGLNALMESRTDIQVVAEAADGHQACEAARRTRPDAVLLDVRMPGVDGISALPHLARLAPVMMLTYSRESALVHESLRLGARGYLVHGEFTADQLVSSVRDLTEGRTPFTATASAALIAQARSRPAPYPLPEDVGPPAPPRSGLPHSLRRVSNPSQQRQNPGPPSTDMKQSAVEQRQWATTGRPHGMAKLLSEREGEIMELIASGMNNSQIAATCFISEKTVKNHINRIFTKLRVTTRSEAIAHWLGTSRPCDGTGWGR
ncbi:response regulator transcription factor [Streptomyces sp. N2-109]|uniref:Response regulator transcription factor n=2 Tax=Streptomyces gossypii TaxID=2883101 RepID=A0ABT2JWF4_9ACTN|nr:response regulator transcription factor [Streptomyces gossypii]MCT2592008.1 response regulator transcription factor [Streptomyces gossypii]